jgi:hypothetical protein
MSREVHLYVGTTRYQNITTSVVNNFFQSVTNAGGVCESGQSVWLTIFNSIRRFIWVLRKLGTLRAIQ